MQAIDHLISAIYGFWVQFLEKFRNITLQRIPISSRQMVISKA